MNTETKQEFTQQCSNCFALHTSAYKECFVCNGGSLVPLKQPKQDELEDLKKRFEEKYKNRRGSDKKENGEYEIYYNLNPMIDWDEFKMDLEKLLEAQKRMDREEFLMYISYFEKNGLESDAEYLLDIRLLLNELKAKYSKQDIANYPEIPDSSKSI